MSDNKNRVFLFPVLVGILLITIGLFIKIPGGVLTTYTSLDGDSADNYVFDDRYSSIDEYVGGDAYNYIIGASLVGGKIVGMMVTKAIFIVGGAVCFCFGLAFLMKGKTEPEKISSTDEDSFNAAVENNLKESSDSVLNMTNYE